MAGMEQFEENTDQSSHTHDSYELNSQLQSSVEATPRREKSMWRVYQNDMLAEQNHQRLTEGVKSRDAQVLAEALSRHFYGHVQEEFNAENHLAAARKKTTEDIEPHLIRMFGFSEDVLKNYTKTGEDESAEMSSEEKLDQIEENLQSSQYKRHLAMFNAAKNADGETFSREFDRLEEHLKNLRCWPVNYGIHNHLEEKDKKGVPKIDLWKEYERVTSTVNMQDYEIDKLIGKHLLQVCYESSPDQNTYDNFKEFVKAQCNLEDEEINEIETDSPEKGEQFDDGEGYYPQGATPRESNDKDRRKKHIEEEKESKQQSEVEEAMLTLQSLRVRAILKNAMFPPVSPRTEDGMRRPEEEIMKETKELRRKYLPAAVNECKAFIKDSKTAIDAARELLKEQSQKNKQEKKAQQQPRYHEMSKEEKREVARLMMERQREAKEGGNQQYVIHKGRKIPIKKRTGWTDRNKRPKPKDPSEPSATGGKMEEFKDMLAHREDLREYISRLNAVLQEIYTDLAEAESKLKASKPVRTKMPRALHLDRNAMLEVRRYPKPPPLLHGIVQSTLLLLGEDEYTTMEWDECKRILNPNNVKVPGKREYTPGMVQRINDFDQESVNDEIAKRADDILEKINLDSAISTCPSAGAFYVWTKGQLDGMNMAENGASPARQIEIFTEQKRAQKYK